MTQLVQAEDYRFWNGRVTAPLALLLIRLPSPCLLDFIDENRGLGNGQLPRRNSRLPFERPTSTATLQRSRSSGHENISLWRKGRNDNKVGYNTTRKTVLVVSGSIEVQRSAEPPTSYLYLLKLGAMNANSSNRNRVTATDAVSDQTASWFLFSHTVAAD